MSTASIKTPSPEPSHVALVQRTVEACGLAREAAAIAAEGIATGSMSRLNAIRQCEKELDAIDLEVDSGVTTTITRVPESETGQLLACMKLMTLPVAADEAKERIEAFLALDPTDKEKILGLKAIQYDIVCNGIELSSGAIRNHRPDVMKKGFAIAGYDESVLEQQFGGMLRALSLGAPPHGGIAPGIDRIVMLLCGEENLREVVLFPMNQKAEDLLMGAPSEVSPKQLRELHIRLNLPQ